MNNRHSKEETKAYWTEYYSFWNDQIKAWFEGRMNNRNSVLENLYGQHVGNLVFDELPEPYYGFPHKGIKAVALHHNPGISREFQRDECQKYFSHIDDNRGWLIRKFRDKCNCSYQKFVEKYSCFIPKYRSSLPEVDGRVENEICGVRWWQGLVEDAVGNEVKWLGQIYGMELNPDGEPDEMRLHPLEVFVLELCPFHSEDFNPKRNFFSSMKSFIMKRVFEPVIRAVIENDLPFAVARGSKFKKLFEAIGLQCEKEWSHAGNVMGWPKHLFGRKKGENVNRTYRLYRIKDEGGTCARILLTWYSGAYNPPADKFEEVERQIRKYVEENPLTRLGPA